MSFMDRRSQEDGSFFASVLTIALGVFIGGLLAALAYTKIMALAVEYEAKQALAAFERDAKAQADRARQQSEAQAMTRLELARQQAADREQTRLEKHAHDAKMRAAWTKLYQPSAVCQADPSTMPCVNAHAVAHKRFMELYGEMPPRF